MIEDDPSERPARATRSKDHERVPDAGHDEPVPVPEAEWLANNRRRDAEDDLLDAEGKSRDPAKRGPFERPPREPPEE